MLRRTRIGSTMDTSRLAAAVSRPGIDTRVWVSLAVAVGDSVVDVAHGVFVDVQLLPTGEELTCRVASEYAGGGFGFYAQIHKDDELLVEIPSGDAAEGPVVTKRLWSASDKPPQEAVDKPEEVLLIIEKDKTLRIKTSGGGQVQIEAEDDIGVTTKKKLTESADGDVLVTTKAALTTHADGKAQHEGSTVTLKSGNVRLGDEFLAIDAVIKGTFYRTNETLMNNQLLLAAGFVNSAGAVLAAAAALHAIPIAGPIIASPLVLTAGTLLTTAGTTMTSAITSFEALAIPYLSTVSKTQ